MRPSRPLFRVTAASAVTALLLAQASPGLAQTSDPQSAPLARFAGDPPGRVGRVARLSGTVSFHTADADQWEPATLNFPVTSGNAFWTQPAAAADLDIGSTRITLDQATELDVETLDDTNFVASSAQGEVYLRVQNLAPGEILTLRTPRGTVTFSQPGRYAIAAGDTAQPTSVTVDSGAAEIAGPNLSLMVGAHQTARITGSDSFVGQVGAEAADPFLTAQLARDQPSNFVDRADAPPVVTQMTGYEAVAETGEWTSTPDYGRVWYPPVEADWVPYRHGRWSWVAPWGWTWVDDAAWGFAPFHYGRWAEIHDRWAWIPVEPAVEYAPRPVYAPALVGFVGLAAGVAIGVGLGASVGWIPLGPREVYRPPYRVSDNYTRRVNVMNVTNVTNVTRVTNVTNTVFINNRAATVVPASVMTGSQSVARQARPVPAAQAASFRPVAQPPVQPSLATRGVTPALARTLNLPPAAPGTAVPQRPAPGPSLQARRAGLVSLAPGRAAPGGSGAVQPVLRAPDATPGPSVHPNQAPATARPNGLPPLAAPGQRGPIAMGAAGTAPGPAFTPRPGHAGAAGAPRPGPTSAAPALQPHNPAEVAPRAAPVQPTPAAPSPRPVPQPVRPAQPQMQGPRAAPQPQRSPAPQPSMARQAPAYRPPAPAQHAAPASAPARQAPPAPRPAPHAAPPPAPHPAPAAHRSCPPNRPNC